MERPVLLFVESSHAARHARQSALEERGFAVWVALDTDEACRRAAAGPDLVLLGKGVEAGEALELLGLLSRGLGQSLPVVALVAELDTQGADSADAGARVGQPEDLEEYAAELAGRGVTVLPEHVDDDTLARACHGRVAPRPVRGRPALLLLERSSGAPSLRQGLLAAGFDVVDCADLFALEREAARSDPHAVLVRDAPALVGTDAPPPICRELAQRVPLFVLADGADGQRHAAWLEAGAAAYLAEPLDREALLERLDPPRRARSRAHLRDGEGEGGGLGRAPQSLTRALARAPGLVWLRLDPKGQILAFSEAAEELLLGGRVDPSGDGDGPSAVRGAAIGAQSDAQSDAPFEAPSEAPSDALLDAQHASGSALATDSPGPGLLGRRLGDWLAGDGQAHQCERLLERLEQGECEPLRAEWTVRSEHTTGGARRLACELFAAPLENAPGDAATVAEGATREIVLVGHELREPRSGEGRGAGDLEPAQRAAFGSEVFWMADADGSRVYYASPAFEGLWGVSREDLLAEPGRLLASVHEEDRPRLLRAQATHAQGSPTELEYRIERPSGELRWVRTRSFPVLDQGGGAWRIAALTRDVTERRLAEQALRESEQRLSSVVTSAPIALFSIDRQGYFRLSDGRGLERMGLSAGEIVGRSIFDVYRDAPHVLANLRRALGGETFTATVELRGAAFETSYSPIFEQNGEVSGVIGVAIDVTDRRRAERRLELIVEATSAVLGQGFFRSLVRYLTRALGVRMAYVSELIPGTERLALRCLWSGTEYREGQEYPSEGSPDALVLRDGTVYYPSGVVQRFGANSWVASLGVQSYLGMPIHDSASRVIGVLGVLHDGPLDERLPTESILRIFSARVGVEIERLRAEDAMRESEARWRSLVENAPDLIATLDREGRVLFANRSLAPERDGRPARDFHLLVGPERERLVHAIGEVFSSGQGRAFEHRLVLPDGAEAWFAVRLGPLERDGQVVSVVLIATDVTSRKEAEGKLDFRASLEKLVTSISTRFINLDAEDVDQAIQNALRQIGVFCGVDRCYVFQFRDGSEALDNTHEWAAHGVEPFVGRIQSAEPSQLPSLLARVRRSGHVFVQRVSALQESEADLRSDLSALGLRSLLCVPMTCAGEAVGFIGFDTVRWEVTWDEQVVSLLRIVGDVFANTLERQRAEESRAQLESQLRQSQKMEAIGTLAGGVAHDFNNLLTGILGYASFLREAVGGDPAVRRAVSVIENAAERAADLTRQLLGFARRGEVRRMPVRVHSLVEEVSELLARTIDKRIDIVHHLEAGTDLILGDPGQMQQVILNLAVNARDAMPQGGRMVFRSRVVELRPEDAHLYPELAPGPYLELSVADTGLGIPKHVQARIFEPFFTTKGPGKGSGMGLAVVYGILRGHGGSIRVESEELAGAMFRLFLPLVEEQAEDELPPARNDIIDGTGSILIVDDEPIVRSTAGELLRSLGYEVWVASEGAEALEVFAARRDEIDLVLLDLVMPVMDGWACLAKLREIDPAVRVVLSSGFGFEDFAHDVASAGLAGFARKPYQLAELSRIVAQALGGAKDGAVVLPVVELEPQPRPASELDGTPRR